MIEYCDKNAKDFNVSAPFSNKFVMPYKKKTLMMDIILMQNRRVFPKLFLDKK